MPDHIAVTKLHISSESTSLSMELNSGFLLQRRNGPRCRAHSQKMSLLRSPAPHVRLLESTVHKSASKQSHCNGCRAAGLFAEEALGRCDAQRRFHVLVVGPQLGATDAVALAARRPQRHVRVEQLQRTA